MGPLCWTLLAASVASHDVECAYPEELGEQLPTPHGCGDCLRLGVAAAVAQDLVILADDGQRDGPPQPGILAIYQAQPSGWQLHSTLLAPGAIPGDQFGAAIACDGTRLVVGAPGDGVGGPPGGAVWIFSRTSSGWKTEARLAPSTPTPGAQFGEAVALHGDLVAVGASRHDRQGVWDVGRVEIFRAQSNAWQRETVIDPDSTTTSLRFGACLAFSLSGQMLAIGAPGFDAPVDRAGAVYCATALDGSAWSVASILQRSNPGRLDRFGQGLARSSQHMLAGIPGSDHGSQDAGALAVLSASPPFTILSERIEPTSHGARMGSQVAGSSVLAGATMPGALAWDGSRGRVRLFTVCDGGLEPIIDLLTHSDMPPLGAAIAIDGWRVVVTAIGEEDGVPEPGRAWVIDLPRNLARIRDVVEAHLLEHP